MILPLIVTIFNGVLENKKHYLISSEVLGLDRNYSIYKVLFPKIRKTIIFAVTLIVSRVFSESIMLSLLLCSNNYSLVYGKGMFEFLGSQLTPVSPLISDLFFSDGSDLKTQSLMFLYGGVLLVISLCFNWICMNIVEQDSVDNTSKISVLEKFRARVRW